MRILIKTQPPLRLDSRTRKWPVPGESGDFMEAVFRTGVLLPFSIDFRGFPAGSDRFRCSHFQRFMKGFSVDGTSLSSLPSVLWWITIECNSIINQCHAFIANLTAESHKLLYICFSSEVHTDTR
jgi:hypothetical protein